MHALNLNKERVSGAFSREFAGLCAPVHYGPVATWHVTTGPSCC
jgi:hypothetical protein